MSSETTRVECRNCGHWMHRHDSRGRCTVVAGTVDGLGDSPCRCGVARWWRRALCRWLDHSWRSLAPELNAWRCSRCEAFHGETTQAVPPVSSVLPVGQVNP